jgi:LmbE family N-acetylglucosaminyl deacetylase
VRRARRDHARAALAALGRAPRDPGASPRCLVVAAHPDDETIGVGALLASLPRALVVHVTDGAPADPDLVPRGAPTDRSAYAEARRRELEEALAIAGVGADRRVALGFRDQDLVPRITEAARAIARLVDQARPALVVAHPYEGGHPDHDAAAVAVHAAVALVARREGAPPIPVVEMSSYHAAGGGPLVTARFLPADEDLLARPLGEADRARKRRMLDAFVTQREVLSSFDVLTEPLRTAPAYDFARPPHDGLLHYERLGWRMTASAFSAQATAALAALALGTRIEEEVS